MVASSRQVPKRSVSRIYEDDRCKAKHCINVRHTDTIEILRFRTRGEAQSSYKALREQGYTLAPKP